MIDQGKGNVLGVLVDAVDYDAATDQVLAAARERRPLAVTALAVHGVMTGVQDPAHNARLNSFDLVTPDGQPVRWALNLLHGAGAGRPGVRARRSRCGCSRGCADEGLPVYLYGSTEADPRPADRRRSSAMFPALKIAGVGAVEVPRRRSRARPARSPTGSGRRARGSCWSGSAARARRSSRTRCARCSTCRCSPSAPRSTTTPAC